MNPLLFLVALPQGHEDFGVHPSMHWMKDTNTPRTGFLSSVELNTQEQKILHTPTHTYGQFIPSNSLDLHVCSQREDTG